MYAKLEAVVVQGKSRIGVGAGAAQLHFLDRKAG